MTWKTILQEKSISQYKLAKALELNQQKENFSANSITGLLRFTRNDPQHITY